MRSNSTRRRSSAAGAVGGDHYANMDVFEVWGGGFRGIPGEHNMEEIQTENIV